MKSIGSLLAIFGIASIVFGFMDRAPKLMLWIYDWGEGTAWAIKIAFVVVGVLLYALGSRRTTTVTQTTVVDTPTLPGTHNN